MAQEYGAHICKEACFVQISAVHLPTQPQQKQCNQNSKVSSGFDNLATPNFMPPLPVDPVLLAPSLPLRGGPPVRPLPLPRAVGLLLPDASALTVLSQ